MILPTLFQYEHHCPNKRTIFIAKIQRPWDRLIMEIPMPVRRRLYRDSLLPFLPCNKPQLRKVLSCTHIRPMCSGNWEICCFLIQTQNKCVCLFRQCITWLPIIIYHSWQKYQLSTHIIRSHHKSWTGVFWVKRKLGIWNGGHVVKRASEINAALQIHAVW